MAGFLERVGRDNPEFLATAVVRSCVPPATAASEGGGGSVELVLEAVPSGHAQCPDGFFRPGFEAEALWREHRAKTGVPDLPPGAAPELRVEPEVAAAIQRAAQRKLDDDDGAASPATEMRREESEPDTAGFHLSKPRRRPYRPGD
jgi:hypothetical protein